MAYDKPSLRKKIVSQVKAGSKGGDSGEWSARKAQLAKQKYEAAGGGYSGPKTKSQSNLSKWTKEEWRTKSGKPSTVGPSATGERYLPKKAIAKLTDSEYKATSEAKRAGSKRGQQFVANTSKAKQASKTVRKAK